MKIQLNGMTGEAVTKRAFYLAWKACGGPLGMGFLQDRPGATEADVWKNVGEAGDYSHRLRQDKQGEAYGDYVFGRMMKLVIHYGNDWVEVADSTPRPDYQAWCRKYPTYEALVQAAIADLEKSKQEQTQAA